MAYKHFYRAIFIRLIIVIALAAGGSWLFFEKHAVALSLLSFVLMLGATVNIIRYFNKINRWISFFLLGIENEDTTLKIPSKSGNKAIDEVYKGMSFSDKPKRKLIPANNISVSLSTNLLPDFFR